MEVSEVHKEGCKLSWSKPEDDGGLPIKDYEIEKLDTSTGKWVRVGKVHGDRNPPTYNVTGLEPGKSYQFRVTAVNDEGDSEPLITTHAIVAKDPYGKLSSTFEALLSSENHSIPLNRHSTGAWSTDNY